MKQLISHLIKTNKSEIIKKSFLNCHVKGLHSIMLLDCPEKTIRMYITDKSHDLYKNFTTPNSLSFHPHYCELTLHCIYGQLTNICMRLENEIQGNDCHYYDRWLYSSIISNGEISFVKDGTDVLKKLAPEKIKESDSVYMKASDIHTVACKKHTVNAWMVYEGKENKNYKPHAWSNSDLSNIDKSGLYIKPTFSQIYELFKSIGIYF